MNYRTIVLGMTLSVSICAGCKRDRSGDWESSPPPPPNGGGWGNSQPPPPGGGWNSGWHTDDDWQPQRWVQVGAQQVSHRNARRVTLQNRADGRFHQIRLTVNGGSLEVYDLSVRLANGRSYTPDFRQTFDSKTRTRVIDLPSTTRSIDQIRFMCRAINRHDKPTITVFAR